MAWYRCGMNGTYNATTVSRSGEICNYIANVGGVPLSRFIANITPIQNLNGQNAPYPAGCGKNLYNKNATGIITNYYLDEDGNETSSSYFSISDYIKVDGYSNITVSGSSNSGGAPSICFYDSNKAFISGIKHSNYSFPHTYTIPTGAVYIRESVSNTYLDTFQLEKGSTATDYAPYENICPITGRTAVSVATTGVNLWDEQWEQGTINDTTGIPSSSTTQIRSKNFCVCKGDTNYYAYVGSNQSIRVFWYDSTQTFISQTVNIKNVVITSPNNAQYFKIRSTNNYGNTYLNDISINYPSTDTAYHAYTGQTATINLGGTYYGGYLNVQTGLLTVTWIDYYCDGSESVSRVDYDSGTQKYYTIVKNPLEPVGMPSTASNPYIISDKFLGKRGVADGQTYITGGGITLVAVLPDQTITTKEAATSWFASNPTHFVYELATPIEIQLTPAQITQLLGENNVWADSGDSEVDFFKIIRT